MAQKKQHPSHIVVGNNVYALMRPAPPPAIVHKGKRYVLAAEPKLPKKPQPGTGTQPRQFDLERPSHGPKGLDTSLLDSPHKEKVERRSLQTMKGLEDAPAEERQQNLVDLLKDIRDPSIDDKSLNYVYHNWPSMKALLDIINSSSMVGELNKRTMAITKALGNTILNVNPNNPSMEEIIENPEAYPKEVADLNEAIHILQVQTPEIVGTAEVLVEAMRVLSSLLIGRGWFKPREFKELKAEYKKLIPIIENFDPSKRKSVQKKTPAKPPSGKAPRGKRQRSTLV
jgi:hypothetical protein